MYISLPFTVEVTALILGTVFVPSPALVYGCFVIVTGLAPWVTPVTQQGVTGYTDVCNTWRKAVLQVMQQRLQYSVSVFVCLCCVCVISPIAPCVINRVCCWLACTVFMVLIILFCHGLHYVIYKHITDTCFSVLNSLFHPVLVHWWAMWMWHCHLANAKQ